jgi:hypothetical protein
VHSEYTRHEVAIEKVKGGLVLHLHEGLVVEAWLTRVWMIQPATILRLVGEMGLFFLIQALHTLVEPGQAIN